MTRWSGALVALAAFCWGVSGGIGGILVDRDWDPFVVSFYRGGVGLLIVLCWLCLQPRGSGLGNRRLWFWSVVAGIGVAGNFTFYFISIHHGSLAVAATLMYCAPVFVYLVSFALKLEKPSLFKWLAVCLVLVGIVLLTGLYEIDAGRVTPISLITGLLAGLSYAIFIFGFKYAAPQGSPQSILTLAFATLALLLLIPSDFSQIVSVPGSQDLYLFAGLGLLGAGLSFFIYVRGLKHTPPAVASIVAMVEPVTASLFGVTILGETLEALQLVGMAIVLVTVSAMGVFSRN
ncbi:EamA family transporter [Marinobacter nanhaiticus D15-8W]|uniref:EamA family transporter n=1 Tax=Marinobacter nanhaiticus D15-8W TaxID=626887 RepID=N6W472_9GAMM|nr:EamA family transporter [Marinobacter nanhaiticus]ENO14954.2 EamA family transporter [Marinobacter nanhaiticus D15-8W]BES69350.1 EamA family transporter [Marinobacter nanhaiticus D15-8W]